MIVFFREKKFVYFQEAPSGPSPQGSKRRGFCFFLQAGLEKPLEPMSGMTVSLPEVDRWLAEAVAVHARGELPPERLLLRIRDFLAERAWADSAALVSLTLREERNWSLSWDSGCEAGSFFHRTVHYEEVLHESQADLWRLELSWTRTLSDDFDYFHESLQLLKTLPAIPSATPERRLSPTSFLSGMSIESRAEDWVLQ